MGGVAQRRPVLVVVMVVAVLSAVGREASARRRGAAKRLGRRGVEKGLVRLRPLLRVLLLALLDAAGRYQAASSQPGLFTVASSRDRRDGPAARRGVQARLSLSGDR